MSGVRNFLQAGYDLLEDIPSAHDVPDLERARHIQLALKCLDPPRDHRESRSQSLTTCPDSPSSISSKKGIQHKKKYRPPALTLDAQHPALQRRESFLDSAVTELGSRHIKSQHSLPTIPTIPLPVPTQAYRSSITLDFPNSSPTSTVASATTFLTIPSAHPPLSPLTPPPLSPSTAKRRRFSRLCRKFGESPPPELVFGELPVPVGVDPRKARVQEATCFTSIMEEDAALSAPAMKESSLLCDLDTSSTSTLGTSSDEDLHRPSSIFLNDAEKLHHISRQYGTACILERKGQRIPQRNYEDILKRLRML
ncbi:hypothetical protein CY34DRAFT_180942 [Suillus luteus UH-Slu-Lm8-n1]|uniref:Uncharacterized protein n=1 Tax=Suillus luteus UH-Slu-Lm8-n1 TaxID=930992 RepID=A0A0D0AJ33_9AGAM|nr:hypothetical protein CY34DRAFT_180942 [Suillus luteus UH-Slu-Lm8-n1]